MENGESKFKENNRIIREETKKTILVSFAMVISVVIYALIPILFLKNSTVKLFGMKYATITNIYNAFNILAIMIVISILTVRKTIYYSPKFVKDSMSLKDILKTWKKLDIILLALGESVSILGLIMSFMGVPFNRTFHFFVTSVLIILIVMPVNWKVRDKLKILEKQRDLYFDF